MDPQRENRLLRLLLQIEDRLERSKDAEGALTVALRLVREHFEADESCLALVSPAHGEVQLRQVVPQGSRWDASLLTAFLQGKWPRLPSDLLVANVVRRDRPWAAICLRRAGEPFDAESVAGIRKVGDRISRAIGQIDRLRIADARLRIDKKIMEQLRPQDLFYQILHSLRSLTHYDHSSALLIHDEGANALDLVAEQIAWRKGKSLRVGLVVPFGTEARRCLESGGVLGFDRVAAGWEPWDPERSSVLAELLDYNVPEAGTGGEPESSLLCAPLRSRDGLLGVLKVGSRHPRSLGSYEASLVEGFLPYAVVAIRNLKRAQSLESGMLQAEKKHVMANLARGVSHDVNNALGAVLPLVQQMISDSRADRADPAVFAQDLEQIESSLQVCRRIFGGMLSFAKGAATGLGQGNVRRAVETTLAILEESMKRRSIEVRLDLAGELPSVRSGQGDLEQLLFNLASNACDAMPQGGQLVVRAAARNGDVEIEVSDTGVGIPPDDLSRVEEPFFTTKRDGNGLGLSICRSIVWEHHGRLSLHSEPQRGTRVQVRLPSVTPPDGDEG